MKVPEVIERLQLMPLDADVITYDDEGWHAPDIYYDDESNTVRIEAD